jgi:uncharacterized protein YciI
LKYLVLTLRNQSFDADAVPAHWDFLDDLRTRGILEQAGAFTDRSGGAYVIKAEGLAAARAIAEQDPLHLTRSSAVMVHEWDAR